MKSNQEMFEELLQDYKRHKQDNEKKEIEYRITYDAWLEEIETNGETEKATTLGIKNDQATADLDKSREKYNFLAHQVLKYYLLSDKNKDKVFI